jgi:small-conductance mechanosensitive channel
MSIQSAVSFLKRKTKNVSRDQTTARYTKEKVDKAKEMAKEVFNTLADPGNPSISAEDLVRKGMSEQVAQAAVEIVTSADDDLGISRKDLLRFCGKVTYDTCALSATLRDSSSIVGTMEGLFNIIIYMVMVIVFLMLFKFNVSDFLLGTSTFIVAAAFALGDSAKNAINNIVFIFFIRPYDVGDRIVLDEDWMIVARIHLTHTVFRIWNGKLRTIPNTELLTMRIDNLRRAGNYTHDKVIEIASDTPLHLIEQLVRCIAACIAAKPREFYPKFTFHLEDIKKEKLLFNLWVTQRSSAQDANTEWTNNRTILVNKHAYTLIAHSHAHREHIQIVNIHTHTHLRAHMHTRTHTYIRTRTHIHIHTYTHMCTHTTHTQKKRKKKHTHTHTHTHTHSHTHTHTHTLDYSEGVYGAPQHQIRTACRTGMCVSVFVYVFVIVPSGYPKRRSI